MEHVERTDSQKVADLLNQLSQSSTPIKNTYLKSQLFTDGINGEHPFIEALEALPDGTEKHISDWMEFAKGNGIDLDGVDKPIEKTAEQISQEANQMASGEPKPPPKSPEKDEPQAKRVDSDSARKLAEMVQNSQQQTGSPAASQQMHNHDVAGLGAAARSIVGAFKNAGAKAKEAHQRKGAHHLIDHAVSELNDTILNADRMVEKMASNFDADGKVIDRALHNNLKKGINQAIRNTDNKISEIEDLGEVTGLSTKNKKGMGESKQALDALSNKLEEHSDKAGFDELYKSVSKLAQRVVDVFKKLFNVGKKNESQLSPS
ncbi:hypothetical protein [Neptuniibacter sp. QD37_11]|uniref:hypothetical protein n=1 Tax=Neptuniibacter sp. QD37_11 TaxID=3398209 RepID=UPI0039F597B1